ncbi:hypothetical protein [Pseudonocardia sp. ICBG1293]|uniref:hypothetical protein n=1 Tax=Pseudonocardia sp. ICBG1293 TaxID=2844382 RepID=UPI001CCB7CF3|nr:hypothetical protein [Pseudonocardia sp. ICBG1293]
MSLVPRPRRPEEPPASPGRTGVVVHRGLPGDRVTWARRAARIGGLLVALADAESGGLELPASLAGRRALWAWSRSAERAVAAAGDADAVVEVHTEDADLLAAAGRDLAAVLRHERDTRRTSVPGDTPTGATGPAERLCALLHTQARRQDVAVKLLVAELGRAARILAPGHLRRPAGAGYGAGAAPARGAVAG